MTQIIHDYVDTAIFTVKNSCLHVLLLKRPTAPDDPFPGQWALPGGYIDMKIDQSLEGTARRKLKEKTGVESTYLEQVATFGDAHRDPRGWSITVVYFALLRHEEIQLKIGSGAADVAWWPIHGNTIHKKLAFDHNVILETCIERLRNKVRYTTLPLHFMPKEFTLPELQATYEALLETSMKYAAFRRRILKAGAVEPTGQYRTEGGRPAELFRMVDGLETHLFTRLIEGPRDE